MGTSQILRKDYGFFRTVMLKLLVPWAGWVAKGQSGGRLVPCWFCLGLDCLDWIYATHIRPKPLPLGTELLDQAHAAQIRPHTTSIGPHAAGSGLWCWIKPCNASSQPGTLYLVHRAILSALQWFLWALKIGKRLGAVLNAATTPPPPNFWPAVVALWVGSDTQARAWAPLL